MKASNGKSFERSYPAAPASVPGFLNIGLRTTLRVVSILKG